MSELNLMGIELALINAKSNLDAYATKLTYKRLSDSDRTRYVSLHVFWRSRVDHYETLRQSKIKKV